MEPDHPSAMVDIDEFTCDETEECDAAYPHQLLLEKHKYDEHPEFRERLDTFIEGENRIEL